MSAIYDNWERLVAAVIKKQQLWELFHEQSRSPSILSDASSSLSSLSHDLSFHSSPPQLVLLSDFSPPFDFEHIDRTSTELLGRGTFGSAYAARINDVKRFVVKSVDISEMDLKRLLEDVGDVRHENVVALRAYYSSSSPHKLLLYDYYSNGSMYSLLFGENRAHVGWETRVRIAIGAAKGIAQIHRQLLVHGNIKSSNILLDQQLYGCVSDLGLTNTTFNPEVKKTQNASQASDVYSFGILLLQLLTRMWSSTGDLVKLVGSVRSKERAAKVFDPDLMKHPSIREQMVEMLKIGIKCVAKSSKKRPIISEVVKMLEDINVVSSPLEGELVFLEYATPIFELQQLMWASAEWLGRKSFGTSFKVTLGNGNIVVMKELHSLTATLKDFQQHMEVFGRINHPNVGRLKAYYYTRVKKFLVYDYFHQGSLSALLRCASLDWDTRMNIAVGAARGIAHIHTQNGGRLGLGNIKSSNILIKGKDCSIGFDAGLANLMNPMRRYRGYSAPEASSGGVSQASDVYSFGVVLLELVSGRPASYLVEWVQSIEPIEWGTRVLDVKCCGNENEEAMVQVLHIAMSCVSFVPELRPTIFVVVKDLEDKWHPQETQYVASHPLEGKLVFLEDASPIFELEYLLNASADVLGRGSFGSSFKATLDNGNIVVVKRLKSFTEIFKYFHQHMEVFGRMNHKNVGRLKAYYYFRDEKFLVYDYFDQGSLSVVLQAKLAGTSLDWVTRVKIAVGAARGIAHIHTQNGGRLVLGNIKSSNILIKGQDCSIGFDAGLANLMKPERPPPTPGYSAPEASSEGVSQASDVYSFGVVLLELVSGRPADSLVEWVQSIDPSEWGAQVLDVKCCGNGNEEAMVQVLQIAMSCVSFVPELRPTIFDVVKELEEFSGVEAEIVLDDRWEESSIQSRLEWLLEDLLPMLSP